MKTLVFDVETEALPPEQLAPFFPEFQAPSNYKDPVKIQDSIDAQRIEWLEKAALSAVTGRVLAIGMMEGNDVNVLQDEDEAVLITSFWGILGPHLNAGGIAVGFFVRSFDLPILIRRSWRHEIHVPECLWEDSWRRYWAKEIIDLADRWACGGRDPRDRVSLDVLSQFLGTGRKSGTGREFGALWRMDRPAALEYLGQDLRLTQAAFQRMVVQPKFVEHGIH